MTKRKTLTLEIADKFDELASIMRAHNVPTLPKLYECGRMATDMLRQQHAEIERLTALNSALTAKGNAFVIENARQEEEIDSLTAELDAAIAAAVATEREACAAVCEAISTGLSAYRDGYGASACLEAIRARSAT